MWSSFGAVGRHAVGDQVLGCTNVKLFLYEKYGSLPAKQSKSKTVAIFPN